MTLRISTAFRNFMAKNGSIARALNGGAIDVYSGSQPATADAAVTGTLLCTFTKSGGSLTNEVIATGTVTLTGGASGSVDTVTVNSVNIIPQGAVAFNTSLTQTATDLAAAINSSPSSPEYTATSSGAVVTISANPGTGTGPNTFVVTATLTTITASYANMSGGVASANGLSFGAPSSGTFSKLATETWSGTAVATGTAGYFRFRASVADAGSLDSSALYIRMDGACATSGSELNMSTTSITSGAVQTINSFSVTQPAN